MSTVALCMTVGTGCLFAVVYLLVIVSCLRSASREMRRKPKPADGSFKRCHECPEGIECGAAPCSLPCPWTTP